MGTCANIEDPDEMPHVYCGATYFGISSGSKLLLGKKDRQTKKLQYLFLHYNLKPLDIYNGPSQVYCIKPGGIIH